MTENKRFTLNQSYLNSKWYYVYDESTDFQFPPLTEGESEIFCEKLNTLHDENKELKLRIREVTNILSEEVDIFSEKTTEHDINAYLELKELDNKDAYYMATATKKAIQLLKEVANE
jgi:hypothetical protein